MNHRKKHEPGLLETLKQGAAAEAWKLIWGGSARFCKFISGEAPKK